ncbi:unnamed protein product, partial [Rotaria socialis]
FHYEHGISYDTKTFAPYTVKKNNGPTTLFEFSDSQSVDEIDFGIRKTLTIGKRQNFSVSYVDKTTGAFIGVNISGQQLTVYLVWGIEELDVLVEPNSPRLHRSSASNNDLMTNEDDNILRSPQVMQQIDARIMRWTNRSVAFILVLYVVNLFIGFGLDIWSGNIVNGADISLTIVEDALKNIIKLLNVTREIESNNSSFVLSNSSSSFNP